MPKMKTHSGAKKRFKTASGKVRGRHAMTSHILGKKSAKRKRRLGRPVVSEGRRDAGQGAAAADEPGQALRPRAQEAPRDARARQGLPRPEALELQAGQGAAAQVRLLRLPRPAQQKRDFRRLWITRINAAARREGMTYGNFMHGLKLAGVELDRKVLADIAVRDPETFRRFAETAREAAAA